MKRAVTIWSESGGVGKTTLTVNTAAALGREGHRVLVIDLDNQAGCLTDHVGFSEYRQTDDEYFGDALLDPENKDITENIVDARDFDLLPSHEALANLEKHLNDNDEIRFEEFQLQRALRPVYEHYDYILCDPQASLNLLVDNAIVATRNLIIPVELTRKGRVSVEGLETTLKSMEKGFGQLLDDFKLNVIAVVPNEAGDANIDEQKRENLEKAGYPVTPFDIRQRKVLRSAWDEQVNIFEYAEQNDIRDYERDVLDIFNQMAEIVVQGTVPEVKEV